MYKQYQRIIKKTKKKWKGKYIIKIRKKIDKVVEYKYATVKFLKDIV